MTAPAITSTDITGLMLTIAGLVIYIGLRSVIERHFKDIAK